MSGNLSRFGTSKRIEGVLSMVTEVVALIYSLAASGDVQPLLAAVLTLVIIDAGVGGRASLLHCGQSEQHDTLQHAASAPVQVNRTEK